MSRSVSDRPDPALSDHDYGSCQPIAIIGAACRFHDSPTPGAYWRNMADGRLLTRTLTDEELDCAGIPDSVRKAPNFVPVASVVPRAEFFDAGFFGFSPQEAESIDPQHRLFLTLAWEALDSAGYADRSRGMDVGVFGASRIGTYRLWTRADTVGIGAPRTLQALIGNDKDYLASRVAYRLGLTGPAITVQTACSSSLVAVHTACEQIRNGECSMALAGGVALTFPQESGYLFHEGMIFSPDGRCRPYDAAAQGTAIGNGAGMVLLKLLDDALADGDPVLAVIRGSAVNNDGAAKTGYTAPSVDGQVAVIREALGMAEVDAGTITLLEGHGTATPLGDPIEVEALTTAFRADTGARGFCALGSVKANLGHCDTAAGIASLLKAVMALHHRQIPPVPGYTSPNPHIDFEASPFHIPVVLMPWERQGGLPRRAGVSSFGIGGTNCHIVLEEALVPAAGEVGPPVAGSSVLLLSAAGPDALRRTAARWADDVWDVEDSRLPALLRTAALRPAMPCRLALSAPDAPGLAESLDRIAAGEIIPGTSFFQQEPGPLSHTTLLFADDPALCVAYGGSLYERNLVFRRRFDQLTELLPGGQPGLDWFSDNSDPVASTAVGIAVLVAMAEVWLEAGLKPDLIVANGSSAFAAAAVSGLLSCGDALSLAVLWAELQRSPADTALRADYRVRTRQIDLSAIRIPLKLMHEGGMVDTDMDAFQDLVCGGHDISSLLLDFSKENITNAIIVVGAFVDPIPDNTLWISSCFPGAPANLSLATALGAAFQAGLGISVETITVPQAGTTWLTPRSLEEQPFWSPEPPFVSRDGDEDRSGWFSALAAAREYAAAADIDLAPLERDEHYAEVLHAVYVGQALKSLGCFSNPGERRTVADILRTTSVKPKFRQLLHRLLRDASEVGVLRREGKVYTGFAPRPVGEALPVLQELRARGDDRLAAVVERGGQALADMLSGRVDPVSVIFPGGSSDDVADMYRNSARSRLLNGIAAKAVAALAENRPEPLTILEIGAGTGGTTWDIVYALPKDRVETYTFTDLGSLFLSRARTTFADFPFMDYRPFDMEQDPHAQGILPGSLDLIVAANVLHNTSDLDALMMRLAGCLRPGGMVLMREITQHRKLFDFVFGPLVPNLDDIDSRDGNLFASVDRWRKAALNAGFMALEAVPGNGVLGDALHENVLLCRMPGQPVLSQPIPEIRGAAPGFRALSAGDLVQALWDSAERAGVSTLALENVILDLDALPCNVEGRVSNHEIMLFSDCGSNRPGYARVGAAHDIVIPDDGQERLLKGRAADFVSQPSSEGMIRIGRLQRRPGIPASILENGNHGTGLGANGNPVLEWHDMQHDARDNRCGRLYRLCPVAVDLPEQGLPEHLVSVGAPGALEELGLSSFILPAPDGEEDPVTAIIATGLALRDYVGSIQGYGIPTAVTLLTRGALSVTSTDALSGGTQAALTGLYRVMATEYPSITLTLIDRDPAGDDGASLDHALRCCRGGHFALRDGRIVGEKLQSVSGAVPPAPVIDGDVAVLVGGISETGLTVARRLCQRGYRDFVLVGRNKPGSGLASALRNLREQGAQVTSIVADAGHRSALHKALLQAVPDTRRVGLMLHLAGVLEDTPVISLTPEILETTLHPKVRGALSLAGLPDRLVPGHTVYFSSAATVFGPAGQAAHAMANAALERLAARQTALGYGTTAVSWGFWGDVRQQDREAIRQVMEQSGMLGMASDIALDLLEAAMVSPAPVYAAMAIDWARVAAGLSGARMPRHLVDLVAPLPVAEATTSVGEHTSSSPLSAGIKGLPWLRQTLSALLNLPEERLPEDGNLIRLGLDSLMFLDLCHTIQTELGIKVTPEAAVEYPTLAELARYMDRLLLSLDAPEGGESVACEMEIVP